MNSLKLITKNYENNGIAREFLLMLKLLGIYMIDGQDISMRLRCFVEHSNCLLTYKE